MYIKNIFSKLFITVDTAKLCKNCLSYEQNIAEYSFIHSTRVRWLDDITRKFQPNTRHPIQFYSSNSNSSNIATANKKCLCLWAHVLSSCSLYTMWMVIHAISTKPIHATEWIIRIFFSSLISVFFFKTEPIYLMSFSVWMWLRKRNKS